jgi:hypothetical protein
MTSRTWSLILVLAAGAACEPTLVGSSSLVTFEPTVGDFDRLELSHEITASVVTGSERRVKVTVNENLRDLLTIRASGDRLRFGMDDGYDYQHLTALVEVTLPALESVELAGASRATLSGFGDVSVARFDAEVSGASRLDGQLATDLLSLALSGASRADLAGTTRALTLELSGASEAGLRGLEAQVASVELSGASSASVLVRGEVRGEASGASELVVHGGAVTNVEISGASSVSRRAD